MREKSFGFYHNVGKTFVVFKFIKLIGLYTSIVGLYTSVVGLYTSL